MLKSTTAKFYYFMMDDEGQDVLRARSVRNVDISATDEQINNLAACFEALTEDVYAVVEKIQTYVIN